MTLRKLLIRLGRKNPKKLAEFYDHVGYQCGKIDLDREVEKVFLCLDYSEFVKDEAESFKPDLIISHHPFYFGDRREIRIQDPKKAELEDWTEERIHAPIYSFHTNFDKAQNGMNETILDMLNLEEIERLPSGLAIAKLGEKTTIEDLAKRLGEVFEFDYVQYLKGEIERIEMIGLLAGGASSDQVEAFGKNVDCYISGDCPHHTRLDMRRYHRNYIELSHECEEKAFLIGMKKMLHEIDPELEVYCMRYEKPFDLLMIR